MIGEARFRENSGEEGSAIQEEEIVERLRRGDPAGLEALMDRYAPFVSAVAARILPGRLVNKSVRA